MWRGSRWFALAALVAIAALVGPTAALADACDGSATSIYTECTTPAPKPKPKPKPASKPTYTQPTYTQPTYTQPTYTQPTQTTTVKPHHRIHKHHKHQVRPHVHPKPKHITPVLVDVRTHESAAFDLGTGPTLLLALLAGTVLLLVGAGGVRTWRNRHRV